MDLNEISDEFVKDYFFKNSLELIEMNEDKPWGAYYVYEETDKYDCKVFRVDPGKILSIQFHGTPDHPGHDEIVTAITKLTLFLSDRSAVGLTRERQEEIAGNCKLFVVEVGQEKEMPAGSVHAYANPYNHAIYFLERRTSQVPEKAKDREANIIRIFDQAARPGTKPLPDKLLELFNKVATG